MLRIELMTQTLDEIVLKVDGLLCGADVDLLEREGNDRLQQAHRLVLDLSDLHLIDARGLALLQQWAGERLVLRSGSVFIQTLLDSGGLKGGSSET